MRHVTELLQEEGQSDYHTASSSESEEELDFTHPDFEMNADIGIDGPCLGRAGMENHLW